MVVTHFPMNQLGRDFAVGDIHGCFNRLQAVLDEMGFDPAKDRLFSVGDMVDRGPDSDQVLEWISRPWFHAVRGNHEDMAIKWVERDQVHEWYRMTRGGYLGNGGAWNVGNPESQQREVAEAFKFLPLAMEVETANGLVGLVHADTFGTSWPDFITTLKGGSVTDTAEAVEHAIWSRRRMDFYDKSQVEGVRAVVVGHNPVDEVLVLGNTHHIDTMGWHRGHFTLLDLATLKPWGVAC